MKTTLPKPLRLNGRRLKSTAKAAALLFAILMTTLLFSSLYENYCGELLNQELKRMLTIARANATYMQSYYQELQDGYRAFVEDCVLLDLLADGNGSLCLQEDLSRFFSRNEADYLYAAVLNAQGDVLCEEKKYGFTPPITPDGIKEDTCPQRGFWFVEDSYALTYQMNIYQDRTLLGSFIGMIDFSAITERLFRYVRLGDGGYLSVCDENGTFIVHPDKDMLGQSMYAKAVQDDAGGQLAYVRESFLQKERGKAIFQSAAQYGEQQILLAFCRAHIAPSHFIVTAMMPYAETIKGIQQTKNQAIAALLLLIAWILLLLWVIFRQMRARALDQAEQRHLCELNDILLDLQSRQNQLHQKENLQAIGVFTSGIAHELSNLLTPIQAYCEMLMLQHHENEALYDSLLEIHRSATASSALAKQLLSFARSSKPNEAIRIPIDINAFLQGCIRSIRIHAVNQIEIDLRLTQTPLYIMGNQSMLHQAVSNLLINACQSMPGGGALTVCCEAICAQDLLNMCSDKQLPFIGNGVMITIRDTGCGMAPEMIQQIFKPFFSTRKDTTGTGLGLMIVQNIINQHDGLITVSSQLGKGSQFCVVLPQLVSAQEEEACGSEREILIVHARHSANLHLYHHLREDGYRLCMLDDPLEAASRFAAQPARYSLLIAEYCLESFSGISLSRTFHRIVPGFPVLLMTSLIHPSDMVFDSVSAPSDVLLTSIEYAEFRCRVAEHLNMQK